MKQHEIKKRQKLLAKIMKLLKEYDPEAMILLSHKLFGFPVFISQRDDTKTSIEVLKTKK